MTGAPTQTPAADKQACLLPELAPPADQPARFAVMGLLRERARVYTQPNGRVQLQVCITQHLAAHPAARPVLATYAFPDLGCPNTTALAARAKAAAMVAGAEVVALGSALYPGEYHGEPFLVLADVAGIALQSPPPPPTAGRRYPE